MINSSTSSLLNLQLLHQLGDRLRLLRKEQSLGTVELAEQAGISRPTLRAVESGDPNTSIGIYLRVMSALGIGGELALLASGALNGPARASAAARSRRRRPAVQITVSADPASSDIHDLQSRALHSTAIELLQHDDQLRKRALATVQQWLRKDPQSRSASLWHEWVETLQGRSYRKVLGRSVHAQQLRQASPLPTIIPSDVRQRLLEEARLLKNGLILDGQAKAGKS